VEQNVCEKLCHLYDNIMSYKNGGLGSTVEVDECHLYVNRRRIGCRMVAEHFWKLRGFVGNLGRFFAIHQQEMLFF
jgi:hypothetical protein